MTFVGEKIISIITGSPKDLDIYRSIFGDEVISQADVDFALAAGYVLPHGLLEAASERLEISVDTYCDIADQP